MLTITHLSDVPSVGALLGSKGTQELITTINRSLGSNSFFGSENDRFGHLHKSFVSKYIEPIRAVNRQVSAIGTRLVSKDYFRSLTTPDDLESCPPCMMPALLTHEPVYNLLQQGRITGWGYTPESLTDAREQYTRLIEKNGVIWYGIDKPNEEDGEYWCRTEIIYGVDPVLTPEDRIAVEETRDYIDEILRTTELDPTMPSELRG